MRLLVVNVGSSSLKLRVLDDRDETVAAQDAEWAGGAPFPDDALAELPAADVVAHRVVHGGERFTAATWVDDEVRAGLAELTVLAPLHQPRALAGMDAIAERLPDARPAACFDTAFHATLPPAASTYALPAAWPRRRFGFHGLSHAYAARRAAALLDRPLGDLRIVTCHLGAGASLAAVAGGRSVATTMGYTPLDGLVMATRSGSVDPGLLLWLLEHRDVTVRELSETLEQRSGLAALAGTGDMRAVLAAAGEGDADARLGLDVYLHRLRAAVAGMAAAMDGLDALVFTGGVGERSAAVRAGAADGLGFLGVGIDAGRNDGADGEADVSAPGAASRTLVVPAREDLEIARQIRELVRAG